MTTYYKVIRNVQGTVFVRCISLLLFLLLLPGFNLLVFVLLELLSRQTFGLHSVKGCDEISCWKHLLYRVLGVSRPCQSLTCDTAW